MIIHTTEVPIFLTYIFFVGNCSADEAVSAVYSASKKESRVDFTSDAAGGVCASNGNIFIWVKDLNKASVVAHELAHAAVSVMDLCQIPLCPETEEVMCYLIGWLKINIQDRVYDKLEKDKHKKKLLAKEKRVKR